MTLKRQGLVGLKGLKVPDARVMHSACAERTFFQSISQLVVSISQVSLLNESTDYTKYSS